MWKSCDITVLNQSCPIQSSHSNSTYNHWLLCTIILASNMLSVTLKLKHLDNLKDDMTEFHNDELNVIVMTQLLVILILMK